MNNSIIYSPISNTDRVTLVAEFDTGMIIRKYQNKFKIDVSGYFEGVKTIQEYKCLDTGYRFFYPFNIAGDRGFYSQLQEFDWYYMPWKWEHQVTAKYIHPGMNVLEVGCGRGDFLKKISDAGATCTGLELNDLAGEEGRRNNINIINQSIEDHVNVYPAHYDLICSFQVLEHVWDVFLFIESQVKCLKQKGKLVISVPNNNSFFKYDRLNDILNLPPHHMGLWEKKSLMNLSRSFNLRFETIRFEPLQHYHFKWYQGVMERRFIKNTYLKNVYSKFKLSKYFTRIIERKCHRIRGHTILAVYSKV